MPRFKVELTTRVYDTFIVDNAPDARAALYRALAFAGGVDCDDDKNPDVTMVNQAEYCGAGYIHVRAFTMTEAGVADIEPVLSEDI